jgi:dTDP-4-dehydrorhamnose reductase
MEFNRAAHPEVVLVESEALSDLRGYLVEKDLRREFAKAGVPLPFLQDNDSVVDKMTVYYQPEWERTIHRDDPESLLNAADYDAAGLAESEPDLARTVIAEAAGVLAAHARDAGHVLIHDSTNCDFDGDHRRPCTEFFQRQLGFSLPPWQEALRAAMRAD